MDQQTLKQARGTADLLHDAVDAAVTSIEEAQRGVVHRTYSVLAKASGLSASVRAIEGVQQTITDGLYAGIHLGNDALGAAATFVLDRLESRAADEAPREVS
ncbi:MAG: hypothetical protein U0768_16350 [Anaerolineae bacterium]